MPRLPQRQLQILEALQDAYERTGKLPDLTALARSFEITYPTLREHLRALEAKGRLTVQTRGPGRSPVITLLGGIYGVPLFGEIAAGLPVGAYPPQRATWRCAAAQISSRCASVATPWPTA